jgi:hypothetical protein
VFDVLTCDQQCLQSLKTNTTTTTGNNNSNNTLLAFDVYDLWEGNQLVASGNTSVSATVQRGGSSAVFRLKPSSAMH